MKLVVQKKKKLNFKIVKKEYGYNLKKLNFYLKMIRMIIFYMKNDETEYIGCELSMSMIQHSFCITTHKSQVSEYSHVILYIPHKLTLRGK